MDNRIDLSQMASELASMIESGTTKDLPLDKWSPQDCGFLPLLIDQQGQWWSTEDTDHPSPYRRPKLVQLLSQLLWCEPADIKPGERGNYSLRTPQESVKIVVEDVPFVIVDYQWNADKTAMTCTTQTGEQFIIGEDHPILCSQQSPYLPYALVRRNLWARFNRNSYYRLIDELLPRTQTEALSSLCVTSQGKTFVIAGNLNE